MHYAVDSNKRFFQTRALGYDQHAAFIVVVLGFAVFLVDFFGEVFEFLELGFYFCLVVGFAYSVDDLADLGC
jgi:hypothetical protein